MARLLRGPEANCGGRGSPEPDVTKTIVLWATRQRDSVATRTGKTGEKGEKRHINVGEYARAGFRGIQVGPR